MHIVRLLQACKLFDVTIQASSLVVKGSALRWQNSSRRASKYIATVEVERVQS